MATRETKQRIVDGSTLSAAVLVALALFVMVNYLAMRHYQRFDWTRTDLYTLSEKSRNVIAGIDRDIDVIVALQPGSEIFGQVDELLARYEAANPRIRRRVIDSARNLLEAQQLVDEFGIDRANVIVIASGDDRRVIEEFDLVEYDYSGAQYGQPPSVQAFTGEQRITSTILDLIEDEKPEIRFVSGHGEATLDGVGGRPLNAARELLGNDNFVLESWSSLGESGVPPGTDLLVVAGPRDRLLETEIAVFDHYLRQGGRMLLMLDPSIDVTARAFGDLGVTEWLARYGVALAQDVVIDPTQRLPLFGPETIFTASYGVHPIVDSLAGRPVLLPLARSVTRADVVPEGFVVTELIRTSAEAWGETDLASLEDVAPDGDDRMGPLSLGVAVTFPGPAVAPADAASNTVGEASESDDIPSDDPAIEDASPNRETDAARLVVLGDFDFAADEQVASGANAALLLNTLNWLTEREQLLAIESRQATKSQLLLSQGELSSLFWLILVLMPGAAIVAGILVHLKRRR